MLNVPQRRLAQQRVTLGLAAMNSMLRLTALTELVTSVGV
jgi:hypothetical protein